MFLMRHNTDDRFLASCTVCQKIKSHRTRKQFCTIVSRVCYISIGLYRVVLAIYKIVSDFITPSEDVTSIKTFETLFSNKNQQCTQISSGQRYFDLTPNSLN